jgi:hypothetical protein
MHFEDFLKKLIHFFVVFVFFVVRLAINSKGINSTEYTIRTIL